MKSTFLDFHVVASTREDLSIDVSITNVGLIGIDEAKVISALQQKSKFNFKLLWKKFKTFGML